MSRVKENWLKNCLKISINYICFMPWRMLICWLMSSVQDFSSSTLLKRRKAIARRSYDNFMKDLVNIILFQTSLFLNVNKIRRPEAGEIFQRLRSLPCNVDFVQCPALCMITVQYGVNCGPETTTKQSIKSF